MRIALHIFGELQIFLRNMNSLPIAKYENESPHTPDNRQLTNGMTAEWLGTIFYLLPVSRANFESSAACAALGTNTKFLSQNSEQTVTLD